MLHVYGRKVSRRVWCSELMALAYWVKSSHTLLYLGNEGVNQSSDTCDPAMLPNKFYFLIAIWVKALQVHAELLSNTRNFSWPPAAQVWRHKCGTDTCQRQGTFSPPENTMTASKVWESFSLQLLSVQLRWALWGCINTKRLWRRLRQWGQTDTLNVTEEFSVLVPRSLVWILNAKTTCLTNNSQAAIFYDFLLNSE